MRKSQVSVLLLLLATTPAGSQDLARARVDSVFADIAANAPGCAVGTYRDGALILARSYGLASIEESRRITARTSFDLGSASKPFTSLAVLELQRQRRLSLDDDVRRYVPELPDYGSPIRVRDLLQHTSGLRDYGSLGVLAGGGVSTSSGFLSLLARQEALNFRAGSRHEYSHSDFELLGIIVARAAKESFGAYVEREVLAPMGMKRTRVQDDRGTVVPERAFGYARSSNGFRVMFNDSDVAGGGNLYTSIEELAHWDHALANAKGSAVAHILTRPTLPDGDTIPYAYGIRIGRYRGLPTLSRGGHAYGMRTEFIRFPEQHFAVATLCNGDHLVAGQRAQQVADLYLAPLMRERRAAYLPPPEIPISAAELQAYAGVYRSSDQIDLSRIVVVNGKLNEVFGDTAQTFTHRGGGVFTADGIPGDFRLAFSRDPSRSMRMSYMSSGVVDAEWERMADSLVWRPDSIALTDYAGQYVSGDLDTIWKLAVSGGQLVLLRAGREVGPLLPIEADVFSRHFGVWNEPLITRFRFHRNPAGRVVEFTITTPPGSDVVRDLRFVRLSAEQ
jgi:CubicO group peptidase (beta-lactamase class C family)